MNFKIKLITAIDTIFLFILCLSGSSSGAVSDILYYLAFLVPILIGLYYIRELDLKNSNGIKTVYHLRLNGDGARLFIPLVFPSVTLIFLAALLTSLALGALGYENKSIISEPFVLAILSHALVPAILEELLFRLVPMKLLCENKRTAIIVSSVLFAFAHANLFQIPYAFLAGLIFALIYALTDSLIPSTVIHFTNNLISLTSIFGYGGDWLIPSLIALAILSLIPIFIMRKKYIGAIVSSIGKEKATITYYPLILILFSLFLAVPVLFA